jgi:hypothetical protein
LLFHHNYAAAIESAISAMILAKSTGLSLLGWTMRRSAPNFVKTLSGRGPKETLAVSFKIFYFIFC